MSETHEPHEGQQGPGEPGKADPIDDLVPSQGGHQLQVVALGGSAGSIEALQQFFSEMPVPSGLAFVVVIHLSADHVSTLSEMLQRCTSMRVLRVDGPVRMEPDKVYVIPPGHLLRSADGELRLENLPARSGRLATVDLLLRTLADTHGPHAAAVVLSGLNGDGAIGIKRMKERGGLTVAQDPQGAQHDGMPRAAIATGMVDWVLPVKDMPARLQSYFRLEKAVSLPPEDGPVDEARQAEPESDLRDVLNFLRTRTGRDFSHYKRATVLRRLGRRMQVNGIDNLAAYLTCLRTRHGEAGALLQDLLISVTNFFRDTDCFEALAQQIPRLFEGKGPGDVVRAWVAGCATGEEAYSVAMLLAEHAHTLPSPPLIQVFATDLDEEAIKGAREGVYPGAIEADVSEERLRRFFLREPRGWRVSRELREQVLFAVHDLLKDSPFSRLDLVTCRNLLIYLNREAQERVLETLHFALLPHGTLMLGASESVDDASPLFAVADKKHRVYAQRPTGRSGLPMPMGAATVKRALEAQQAVHDGPVISGLQIDTTGAPPPQGREAPRGSGWGELHLRLLEMLGPPSVLLNADFDIVHLSPGAGRYLRLAGGEPSRSMLRSVAPEVRIELSAALYQAAQTRAATEVERVGFDLDGSTAQTRVRIAPLEEAAEQLYLVTFEPAPLPEGTVAPSNRGEAEPLSRHLDREIDRLKSQLRDTVEQYEASTEELKASNEELQAMNEELRAATEELETSREELQSINEELTTVNQELKSKVEQLSHANSDMHNLMDATAIATIFLDRALRIMRYTPSAVDLFNLIPTDLGRPLTDMASRLDYPELGEDARRVLERLVPVEREVGQANGSWYLARLMPYRTLEDRIAGVVFTFIDITERKHAEEVRLWLSAVVVSTSDAIISFAPDRTILSWNSGAAQIFGYTAEEAIGQPLSLVAPDREQEQAGLLSAIAEGRAIEQLQTVGKRKDGGEVQVCITASPIRDASDQVLGGTAVVRDVSVAHAATEALRQAEERLRMVIDNAVEYAIFSTDLQRRVTIWNPGAQRLLGYGDGEMLGRSADVIFTDEDRAAGAPEREAGEALALGRASDERTHRRKDGSTFAGSGVMMVMRSAAGEPMGFVKILRDRSVSPGRR